MVKEKNEHDYDFTYKFNDDLECAYCRQRATISDGESEEKDMEFPKTEEECIKTIFQ